MVATPLYGDPDAAGLSQGYAGTLYALGNLLDVHAGDVDWGVPSLELEPSYYPNTIVHGRNSCVDHFLESDRNYTHLLFWDADVSLSAADARKVIGRMLRADRRVIGVPYVAKRFFLDEAADRVVEALFHTDGMGREIAHEREERRRLARDAIAGFSVRYIPDLARHPPIGKPDEHGLVRMDAVPIGYGLLRRDALEQMVTHYAEKAPCPSCGHAEHYTKIVDGKAKRYAGIFNMTCRSPSAGMPTVLRDEDFAFCDRWRELGGDLYLYVGEGAPLGHVGRTLFRGTREALLADWQGR